MNRAIARLQEAAIEAVDCLCEVQRDGESESARVSAARTIPEQALRAVELGDVLERLGRNRANHKSPQCVYARAKNLSHLRKRWERK